MKKTDVDMFHDSRPGNLISLTRIVEEVAANRPSPIRIVDQAHMILSDVVSHIAMLSGVVEGKDIVFMGDSDCVALSLMYAGHNGLLPCPSHCILCDFDERVLKHVENTSDRFGFSNMVDCIKYNVFDPVPDTLQKSADIFHTNPPYGQFNGGSSIIAFVERAMAMIKTGGEGIIVLANDSKYIWTEPVLRNVLLHLISKDVTPYKVVDAVHHYQIDDQPDLRSGFILCRNIDPSRALSPAMPLAAPFLTHFYGRAEFNPPHFIRDDGTYDFD